MYSKLNYIQNYIFDMDGTLVNSSEEVLSCLKLACQNTEIYIEESKFTSEIIGPPIKEILNQLISTQDDKYKIEAAISEFRRIYDNNENDKSTLYENIEDWLSLLKNSGKTLFLATNKPMLPTQRLIKKLNLDMFEDVYTIDKYENRQLSKQDMIESIFLKYNLDKTKTIMVGDALSDVKAAHNLNVKAIGVLWGYESKKSTLRQISDYTIELSDLKGLQKV